MRVWTICAVALTFFADVASASECPYPEGPEMPEKCSGFHVKLWAPPGYAPDSRVDHDASRTRVAASWGHDLDVSLDSYSKVGWRVPLKGEAAAVNLDFAVHSRTSAAYDGPYVVVSSAGAARHDAVVLQESATGTAFFGFDKKWRDAQWYAGVGIGWSVAAITSNPAGIRLNFGTAQAPAFVAEFGVKKRLSQNTSLQFGWRMRDRSYLFEEVRNETSFRGLELGDAVRHSVAVSLRYHF